MTHPADDMDMAKLDPSSGKARRNEIISHYTNDIGEIPWTAYHTFKSDLFMQITVAVKLIKNATFAFIFHINVSNQNK